MDSTLVSILVTATVTLIGAWLGLRGTRATTNVNDLSAAASYWKAAVDRQDIKLVELTGKVEAVTAENEALRRVLIGSVDRLARIPPPDHDRVRAYILENIPSLKE